jgi:hypothetical protein
MNLSVLTIVPLVFADELSWKLACGRLSHHGGDNYSLFRPQSFSAVSNVTARQS